MEQLIARVREEEQRLKEEIEQRAALTLETVQLAKRQSLERIEREAEQVFARYIEAKKGSCGEKTAWINEAMERIEMKRQRAKTEANRLADEIVARVREREPLTQLDMHDRFRNCRSVDGKRNDRQNRHGCKQLCRAFRYNGC